MDRRNAEIGETLLRVLNKFLENQKMPRKYGLEELLYPAEVHTIALIGKYPGAGVTELARKAGLTKGAVSQMTQKLEKKGLICRLPDSESRRRVILELTNKGKIAYYSHERMHEDMDRDLLSYLEGLRPTQIELLQRFLSLIEKGIDKRNET